MDSSVFVLALFATVVTTAMSLTIMATNDMVRVHLGEEIHLSCDIPEASEISEVRWYRGQNITTYGSIDVTNCGVVSLPCPEVNTTDSRGVVRYERGTSNEATLTLVIHNSSLEDNTSFWCGAVKDSGSQPQPDIISVTIIDLPNVNTLTPDYQTTYMDPVDPNISDTTFAESTILSRHTSIISDQATDVPETTPNPFITTVITSKPTTSSTDSSINTTVITATASAGVIIIIILLVIIACLISSRKRRRNKKESRGINFRLSVEINSAGYQNNNPETYEYDSTRYHDGNASPVHHHTQITSPATQQNNQGTNEYNNQRYHDGNASHIYQNMLNCGDQGKGSTSSPTPPPPVYAAPTKNRPSHLMSADDCSYADLEKSGRRAQDEASAFDDDTEMGYQGSELRNNAPPVYALLEPDNEPVYQTTIDDCSYYATVDKPGKRAQTENSQFDDEAEKETQDEEIPHQVPPVYAVLEPDNESDHGGRNLPPWSDVEINDSGWQDTMDMDDDGNANTDLQEQEPQMILDQGMYAEVHQGRVLGSRGSSPCDDDDDSLTLKSSPRQKVKGLARLDPY